MLSRQAYKNYRELSDMSKITRRDMLRTTVVGGSAAVVSWFGLRKGMAVSNGGSNGNPEAGADSGNPQAAAPAEFSFFTPGETAFIDAALSRLIPKDELGPGAREAGVTFFIDQQLAGAFGRAQTWYMQGPWKTGVPEQGYQLKLTPAQFYRAAIAAVDEYCRGTFANKSFAELAAADQDTVLHGLEKGDINLNNVPAKDFFSLLWQNTNEGFFSDPLYGGNRDFAGWKLVGYPGPRYNYINEIEQYGKAYPLPPVGLLGRNGKPQRED
jgi:gluconate 2-dehydrogenase gamma chain